MSSPPSPEALRDAATRIVSGSDYQLDKSRSESDWTLELLIEIVNWILTPIQWLLELTEGLPDVLRWLIIVGLLVLVVVLVWHMIRTFLVAMRGPTRASHAGYTERQRGFSAEELERFANEAGQLGNHIEAIRFLFRASVTRLEDSSKQKHRPGATNRDLLKRFSQWPEVATSIRYFVEVIDRKWYGDEFCSEFDYERSQTEYQSVCGFLRERGHALGA